MQMVQVIPASSGECGHGRRLREGKYKVWTSTALDRSTTLGTMRVPVENAFDVITLITPLSSMLFVRERERNVREIFWTLLTLIMMIRMVISGLSVLVSQNRGCSGVVSSSR